MKNKLWKTAPYLALFSVFMLITAFVSLFFSKTLFYIEMSLAVVGIIASLIIYLRFDRIIRIAVKSSSEKAVDRKYLDRFGFPVVAVDKSNSILWYNTAFYTNVCDENDVSGYSILNLISGCSVEQLCSSTGGNVTIGKSKYTVYANPLDDGYVLYFFDDTYYKDTEKKYIESRISVAMIVIDNSEIYDDEDEDNELQAIIQVESLFQKFANEYNGYYRKTAKGHYMIIFEEKDLEKIIGTKFEILEKIRAIRCGDICPTVSMGIGRGEENLRKSHACAKKALDMSLGRGGDQVSILCDGKYEFFGGKATGTEHHSKVRVRVIAKSIVSACQSCDKVIVMGHKFSDLDCIGSAIGLYGAITSSVKKPVQIAVDFETSMSKGLIDFYKAYAGEEIFVSPREALSSVTDKTLLIVVDTQSEARLESTELFKACKNIIVIDHHRMSVDHIENTLVFYHEPGASSTSEMCVEIIDNFPDVNLKKAEAEALLSGIILDTKNFVINSGSRTFEAASYLKKHGADTVSVRQFFADSIELYQNKYKLISTAKIYKKCAIVIADEEMDEIRLVASKSADELLGLKGVNASFVLFRAEENVINISARSYGKRNVQLIMEKLGGGGHHSMAAAQIKNVNFESAVRMLIDAIDSE
ncbi:MAG: DHH family phosphoesterase [Eubacteriales bacterium]|nr:DHH family phosphoesterase [Eubacteriales bacterium]